jgi:hypothetical protein
MGGSGGDDGSDFAESGMRVNVSDVLSTYEPCLKLEASYVE